MQKLQNNDRLLEECKYIMEYLVDRNMYRNIATHFAFLLNTGNIMVPKEQVHVHYATFMTLVSFFYALFDSQDRFIKRDFKAMEFKFLRAVFYDLNMQMQPYFLKA